MKIGISPLEPKELNVSEKKEGVTISIIWSDGHRSSHDAYHLRKSCPCAMCKGEPGIFGKHSNPVESVIPRDVSPEEIQPVGRYAVKFVWTDGHNLGIYSFDYLRKLCECGQCQSASRMTE